MRGFRGLVDGVLGLVVMAPAAALAVTATPSPEVGSMGAQTVPEVIERYVAALSAHDRERAASLYTEDAVVTQAVQNGNTFTGREEIAGWVGDNLAGLPDLKVTVGTVVQDGDGIAWEWTYTGSYTGQFPGAPKGEGQQVMLKGISVMEIGDDGLIARETLYYDNFSFLTQIGVAGMTATPVSGSD